MSKFWVSLMMTTSENVDNVLIELRTAYTNASNRSMIFIKKRAKMVKDKKKFCTMRQTEKMVKNVFGIRGFKGAFQVKGVQLRVISKSFKTIARITKFHCRLINPKVIF